RKVLATGIFDASACRWSRRMPLIACVSGNSQADVPGSNFANKAPSDIVIIPAAGGKTIPVVADRTMNQSPEWSPLGDRLFFVSNRDGPLDVYELAVTSSGTVRGAPMRVTTGLNARSISVTADASHVAYALYSGHANIYSVPIPKSGVALATDATAITNGPQTIESMHVSPDEKWLVYDSDRDGAANIFRVPIAGGESEQLTHDSFDEFSPDMSPDDRFVAYHSFRTGTRDVEVKPLDGGPVEFVTNSPKQESFPMWSPDGTRLLFFDQGIGATIYVSSRVGPGKWSAPRTVSFGKNQLNGGVATGAWSPDGKWIVTETSSQIIVAAADSNVVRVVYTAKPGEPAPENSLFSRDGRSIYFKSHDADGRATLYVIPASGGEPRAQVRFPDLARQSSRQGFGLSTTHFYFPIEDRQSNVWIAELSR
ncbi:MAG: hypothetical protein ACREMU_06590, partial [Gemmatimonadaceae bacterium]